MTEILTSIHGRRFGLGGPGQLILDGVLIHPVPNPTGAKDYYVDGNVGTSKSGDDWENPLDTLAEAIALSNTSIGLTANRWWARRNRIFILGDQEFAEDLVVFPEKCDIIGLGFDIEAMPRIEGEHVIEALATGKAYGTRFFNVGFMAGGTNVTIHLTTDHMGVEFWGCKFWPNIAGSTHCIRLADNNRGFKLMNSQIYMHPGAPGTGIFAEAIKIEGVGQIDMIIKGNYIHGTEGIHTVTAAGCYNGLIQDNVIYATALTINDVSDKMTCTDNKLFTEADPTAALTGAIVANDAISANNRVSSTAGTERNAPYPPEVIS